MLRATLVAILALGCQPIDGGGGDGDAETMGPHVQGAGGAAGFGGQGGEGGQGLGGAGGQADAGEKADAGQGGEGGQPVECDIPPTVTAELISEGPFTRADAVEIAFTVEHPTDVHLVFEAMTPDGGPGGRFVEREDRVFWSAGGNDLPEDVDFPWFTGEVTVRVVADGGGCVGSAEVQVTLVGDFVVTDSIAGGLFTWGSDGRYLGRYGQLLEGRGLGAMLPLPEAAGGGLLVVIGKEGGRPRTELVHIDREGARVREWENRGLAGEELWDDSKRQPNHLLYWAERGEVLMDNAPEGAIHRWDLEGTYLGTYQLPQERPEYSIGFAMLEGRPVAGSRANDRLYFIDTDPPELLFDTGDGFDDLIGLSDGLDGSLLALMRRGGNEFRAYTYDRRGDVQETGFMREATVQAMGSHQGSEP